MERSRAWFFATPGSFSNRFGKQRGFWQLFARLFQVVEVRAHGEIEVRGCAGRQPMDQIQGIAALENEAIKKQVIREVRRIRARSMGVYKYAFSLSNWASQVSSASTARAQFSTIASQEAEPWRAIAF